MSEDLEVILITIGGGNRNGSYSICIHKNYD
ncbi:hypothetical protein CLMAG_02620 [Clostridium magnum DSM 2767]|uniref:Uncharacterized protein n=1 Tax=Clostridium magnum DSM 2767 TaxID=1121326 RepID=A0A161Y515_9CLOT|nr:hypothetical protein CLMAG_02620 [Clostridium magnum DSM 2767]